MLHTLERLVVKIQEAAEAGTCRFWNTYECDNDGGLMETHRDARAEVLFSGSDTLQRLAETIGMVLDARRAMAIAKAMADE